MVATNDDVTLDEFFRRPLYYTSYTWTPNSGTVFGQNFNPWTVFFTNPRVSNRISNYNLLQAKLCVKFLINGNGFYYGRLMADYMILPGTDTVSSVNTLDPLNIVQASQRMHVMLDPTESQGATMYLPFIWPYNALKIPLGEWSSMGTVYLREMNSLKHANASTQPLNISVYIWAEDVKLSVPTSANASGIVAQANEYMDSPVSNLASAVSGVATKLSKMPIIGPYARATDMVAGTVGNVAKLFGFSRPASIEAPIHNVPRLIGNMANTDTPDSVTKLTIEAKQELSVDPRIFGAKRPDELNLAYIASIPSFLTTFTWATTNAAQTLLWNSRVTPCLIRYSNPLYYMPACAFAANPFNYWRGTMRFRFQIVASKYHTGRLAFVYDPNSTSNVKETNVAFTKVVDLGEEREFTIDVSWAHQASFLRCNVVSGSTSYGTTALTTNNSFMYNGTLSVFVVNELATPNSVVNNDIGINVWISMCDDAEFQGATEAYVRTMSYGPVVGQADEYVDDTNAPAINSPDETVMDCLPKEDGTYLVYFGERVTSFRQLLKRYNFHSSYYPPSTTAGVWKLSLTDFPYYRGLFVNGFHTSGVNKSYIVNNTLLNYLAPAYVGMRGGLRSKYISTNTSGHYNSTMTVSRTQDNPGPANYSNFMSPITTTSVSAFASQRLTQIPLGIEGMEVTTNTQQPVVEVEFPFYRSVRFDHTRSPGMTVVDCAGTSYHNVNTTVAASTFMWIDRFVAVGEDFQLFLFQGAPPMGIVNL